MQRDDHPIVLVYDEILQFVKDKDKTSAHAAMEQLDKRQLDDLLLYLQSPNIDRDQLMSLFFSKKSDQYDIKQWACIYVIILLSIDAHLDQLLSISNNKSLDELDVVTLRSYCLYWFEMTYWRDCLSEAIHALPSTDLLFNKQVLSDKDASFLALFEKLSSRMHQMALNQLRPYLVNILNGIDEFVFLFDMLSSGHKMALVLNLAEEVGAEVFDCHFGSLSEYLSLCRVEDKQALLTQKLSGADLERYDVFEEFISQHLDDYFIVRAQLCFHVNQYNNELESFELGTSEYNLVSIQSIQFFLDVLQGSIPDELMLSQLAEHEKNILNRQYWAHIDPLFLKKIIRLLESDLFDKQVDQARERGHLNRFFSTEERSHHPWILRQKGFESYGAYSGFFIAFNLAREPNYTNLDVSTMRRLIVRELKLVHVTEYEITPLEHIEALSNVLHIPIIVLRDANEHPRFKIIKKMGLEYLGVKPPVFVCQRAGAYVAIEVCADYSVEMVFDVLQVRSGAPSIRL